MMKWCGMHWTLSRVRICRQPRAYASTVERTSSPGSKTSIVSVSHTRVDGVRPSCHIYRATGSVRPPVPWHPDHLAVRVPGWAVLTCQRGRVAVEELPRSFHNTRESLVRIYRSVTPEPIDGMVVGLGRTWALLQVVDDAASLDGYTLVRVAQVTEVKGFGLSERFVRRSLELRGAWPPRPPAWSMNLDRTDDLISALVGHVKVVGIYIEEEDPDVFFVGVPFIYMRKLLGLREIDASGQWCEELSEWDFNRLTRIDFDSLYLARVLEVARRDSESFPAL